MKHSSLLLALVLVALVAPPAFAASQSIDIPSWSAPREDGQPSVARPIITADGSIVFGVRRSNSKMDIVRLPVGETTPETHATVPLPDEGYVGGPFGAVSLTAAGAGFFLYWGNFTVAPHCCSNAASDSHLTWVPDPTSPGTEIRSGSCQAQSASTVSVVGGATNALLTSRCFQPGAPVAAVLRDLATGMESPISLSIAEQTYNQVAGPYVSGTDGSAGRIIDWTTGETVRSLSNIGAHVLLADGTV